VSGQSVRTAILLVTGVVLVAAGIFLKVRETVALALIVIGAGEVTMGAVLPRLSELEIGPTKFSAKLRDRDAEFRPIYEQEAERLTRLAALVSEAEAAPRLTEQALAKTYAALPTARTEGPEVYTRSELVEELSQHHAPVSEATPKLPDQAGGNGWRGLADALGQLSADRRLAVALKVYDQLDDGAIAKVLKRPPEEIPSLIAQGSEQLTALLGRRSGEPQPGV
jgi:DNA-directed RNA polymerase specialized sigma24 family protein